MYLVGKLHETTILAGVSRFVDYTLVGLYSTIAAADQACADGSHFYVNVVVDGPISEAFELCAVFPRGSVASL